MNLYSSAIGVEVKYSNLDKVLVNHSIFEKNGNKSETNSFYSIIFTNETKELGEIHFTKSYEYGNLNTLPFVRIQNVFFILTSSTQHLKFFKKIINDIYKQDIEYNKLTLLPKMLPNNIIIKDFTVISKTEYEMIGVYELDSNKFILKFYSNGILNFPLNNNVNQLLSILKLYLKILNEMRESI